MSISSRWQTLHRGRNSVLARARAAAALTIPSLMPPDGSNENTVLPQPYQSLGARGVNNLASKLLLALMPPGNAFFRLRIDPDIREELGVSLTDAEEALRKQETLVLHRTEEGNLRTTLFVALKFLVALGNALLYLPADGRNRVYPLDRYCVVRGADGTVVEIVIKETVNPLTLDEATRTATEIKPPEETSLEVKDVDVFTHVRLVKGKHVWHQEINDIKVPDSDGESPADTSPFLALRWTALANENYGRGHVEEYIGDLRSLEGLSGAIVSFSAAAARIIIMLRPNAALNAKDLAKPSGSVVTGNVEDAAVFGIDKFPDFQVAKAVSDDLTLRLSHAFLLTTGTIRQAERVTAEEVRLQAQELEDVLGGVFSTQSQELQLPIVNRYLALMREEGTLPVLPGVAPSIITGFDALGRGHELNKLRAFFQDAIGMFGEQALQFFNAEVGLKMLATQHNVEVKDLIRTLEDVQAEQQQQQQQALAEKAAGPVAGAVAQSAVAPQ